MTLRTTTVAGRLMVQATDKVSVIYDSNLNMIEVYEGAKVVVCGIAPRGYTLNRFCQYVQRVQKAYV
jgi:hypothetical protein